MTLPAQQVYLGAIKHGSGINVVFKTSGSLPSQKTAI
jgi:hypothetical protein